MSPFWRQQFPSLGTIERSNFYFQKNRPRFYIFFLLSKRFGSEIHFNFWNAVYCFVPVAVVFGPPVCCVYSIQIEGEFND